MAVKKATAKAKAKRSAPKPKGKAKAKEKAKAAGKAKPKGAEKAKSTPKATPKPKPTKSKSTTVKPRKARAKAAARNTRVEHVTPVAAVPQLDLFPADVLPPIQPKKGPFARLAGGVGSLLARVTGKKKSPESTHLDQTIELATADILAVTATPPPVPKRKR